MLRSSHVRRLLAITAVGLLALPLLGYMMLIFPNRARLELKELQREYTRRSRDVGRVDREYGASRELAEAKAKFKAWQAQTRTRCMEISATNPNTTAGASALLMVARWWPDSPEAKEAHALLLELAGTLAMEDLAAALNGGGRTEDWEAWRPFAAQLTQRVRNQPDHQDSAWVLARASTLVRPARYSAAGPCKEFDAIADLLRGSFASHKNIQNFCEVVGGNGNASAWGLAYEPHLREILRVNTDRFVRCTAKFNLASIVQAGGLARQAEARGLFEEFLREFDGQTDYVAQSVELANRQGAQEILKRMRLHGLGMPAVATVGVDLNGQPMSLEDYRGKVVLLSFWATTCGPCMRAIPHERALVAHFDPAAFAIVGVNGDTDKLDRARAAVKEHGITWRSFQSKRDDGTRIDRDWHLGGWPTFYLLDANGTIAATWQGLPPPATLQEAIGALIHAAKQDNAENVAAGSRPAAVPRR